MKNDKIINIGNFGNIKKQFKKLNLNELKKLCFYNKYHNKNGVEYKIKQYRPAFFSGFENEICSFSDKKSLLEISFVKKFSEQENFYRFSISRNFLISEYEEGDKYYTVGMFLDNDENYITDLDKLKKLCILLELPEFD